MIGQPILCKEHELVSISLQKAKPRNLEAMSLRDDLVVLIPDDDRFYKDNRLYLQTDTYVKQNSSNGRTPEEIAIVRTKPSEPGTV